MISNKRKITLLLVVVMIVSVITVAIASESSSWLVTECSHDRQTKPKYEFTSYTPKSATQHYVTERSTATCLDCGEPVFFYTKKDPQTHSFTPKTEQVTPHLTKKYQQCTKCGYKTSGTVVYH